MVVKVLKLQGFTNKKATGYSGFFNIFICPINFPFLVEHSAYSPFRLSYFSF